MTSDSTVNDSTAEGWWLLQAADLEGNLQGSCVTARSGGELYLDAVSSSTTQLWRPAFSNGFIGFYSHSEGSLIGLENSGNNQPLKAGGVNTEWTLMRDDSGNAYFSPRMKTNHNQQWNAHGALKTGAQLYTSGSPNMRIIPKLVSG